VPLEVGVSVTKEPFDHNAPIVVINPLNILDDSIVAVVVVVVVVDGDDNDDVYIEDDNAIDTADNTTPH
jgi:hypothetical protein